MLTLDQCVRLYDENGEHKLTVTLCHDAYLCGKEEFDLADPDGKVFACEIDKHIVQTLIENVGVSLI